MQEGVFLQGAKYLGFQTMTGTRWGAWGWGGESEMQIRLFESKHLNAWVFLQVTQVWMVDYLRNWTGSETGHLHEVITGRRSLCPIMWLQQHKHLLALMWTGNPCRHFRPGVASANWFYLQLETSLWILSLNSSYALQNVKLKGDPEQKLIVQFEWI